MQCIRVNRVTWNRSNGNQIGRKGEKLDKVIVIVIVIGVDGPRLCVSLQ